MHNQITKLENGLFNPDLVIKDLSNRFTWIKNHSILVSSGMLQPVESLLIQIEQILGSSPKLTFFRVTEDKVDDEIYQRQILVFLNSRTRDDARIKALKHIASQVNAWSKSLCYRCGQSLVTKNIGDAESLRLYPFLEYLDKVGYRRTFDVCMKCCKEDWNLAQSERKKQIENCAKSINTDSNAIEDDKNSESVFVTIYKKEDIDKIEQNAKEGTRDQVQRVKALINKIKQVPVEKRLVSIPKDWENICDDLSYKFPNFYEVVLFIRNQLALSSVGDKTLRISPILLSGSPGVGKTEFLTVCSKALGSILQIINVSNSQTGSALTGSEAYWSNSQTGMLFNTLMFGNIANPIYMLDEIDKSKGRVDENRNIVLSALHQLLEPRQASNFSDLSIPEITFDASYVIWIATANDLTSIDRPILDRFNIFEIREPSKEQMVTIVTNQYARFIRSHPSGKYFQEKPSDDVINKLIAYHPRKSRKILENAFGNAAYARRNFLILEDLNGSQSDKQELHKSGIGYLAEIN